MEGRLHLRHIEEGHQQPGLLRPLRPSWTTGVLDRVHQPRQSAAGRSESEVRGDGRRQTSGARRSQKDGTRVKPEFGSVWYHLMGASKDQARTHMTIAVPGATTASMGLPDNGKGGGVWIMNAGTTTAHLMTPGE